MFLAPQTIQSLVPRSALDEAEASAKARPALQKNELIADRTGSTLLLAERLLTKAGA